jgi:predicted transcriptional regulator of viral defense system
MFDSDAFFDAIVAGDIDRHTVGPVRTHWLRWDAARRHLLDGPLDESEQTAVALACDQGFVLTQEQARGCGVSPARIRQLVRSLAWTAPRRRVLSVLPPGGTSDEPAGDCLETRSAAAVLVRPGAVVSHDCAAALHGLPLLRAPARVELTAPSRTAAATCADAVIRVAAIPAEDITSWFGAGVTTLARTVIDQGRRSTRSGLVSADAALHEGLIS